MMMRPAAVSQSQSRSGAKTLVAAPPFGKSSGGVVVVVPVAQGRHWEELKSGKGSVSWRLRWRVQPARHQAHQGSGWRVFAVQAPTTKRNVNWILESVGDGDCAHLDAAVPLPGSFELASESAIVGRAGGKADILLGVATVSSMHARLEKRGDVLYVTDLDSTNGTYLDGRRIRPGAVTPVDPGSILVFGDEHLAVFRVGVEEAKEAEPQESEVSEESPSA
ncbi:hypothetical protein Mp_1g24440 [Marchantia polymorpha subsp. ruderalis]|nr:hypothetical protein MARPO_0061s0077 [Marchantia polymorpha]BBM99862.1 hypothetical protein Mp_1g24440 [Marchantia polymorpha subsp. ruderalis]|eukprot:PTQ36822.1 hypothetical protein MARPO_0061s0077 [Marchantia polymorpha]